MGPYAGGTFAQKERGPMIANPAWLERAMDEQEHVAQSMADAMLKLMTQQADDNDTGDDEDDNAE